ncbi:MAG: YybS family protein [Desulfarculales bacterium]|jgi:uncharacterized protein YybS (DUF2232 family)|nr:YybS family protein [Desulfarculales bacterium]
MENELTAEKKSLSLYLSALLSSLFFAGSLFVPVLIGIVLLILSPLPLLWVYLNSGSRGGRQACLLALLTVLALVYFNFSIIAGLPFLFFAALAAGAGESMNRGGNRLQMLIWGAICPAAVNIAYFVGLAWYSGQDVQAFWNSYWAVQVDNWNSTLAQPGLAADWEETRRNLYRLGSALFNLAISISLINFMFITWINLFFLNRLSRRAKAAKNLPYESLSSWRSPFYLVWILPGAALLVGISDGFVYWLGLNILLLTCAVYWFHGLAVAACLCDRKNVPPWLRILFLLVMVFVIYLSALTVLLGLSDAWFNWRKIKPSTDNPGGI